MFNAEKFCLDYNIESAPRGNRHHRKGWMNISCPHCSGAFGYYLGINIKGGYSSCYRCGYHWLPNTIAAVARVPINQAIQLIARYSTGEILQEYQEKINRKSKLDLPPEFERLSSIHWAYLKQRNFNPATARSHHLLGTCMRGNYAMRIIAPIYLDGMLVSYQGRDVTGKQSLRYKACAAEDEVWPHQDTLYGIDDCKKDTVIIVEGITDRWRMGADSVAVFGIDWSASQARMIANRFKKFFVIFDDEEAAQEKALSLYHYLTARNLDGEIITLNTGGDPGELTDKTVIELKGDLGI